MDDPIELPIAAAIEVVPAAAARGDSHGSDAGQCLCWPISPSARDLAGTLNA